MRRPKFELFVSQAVLEEVSAGDPVTAAERMDKLRDLQQLDVTDECLALGRALLAGTRIPPDAATDALHVATAAVHGMNYLVTWNCRHIANATLLPSIQSVCTGAGHPAPVICTPLELMED